MSAFLVVDTKINNPEVYEEYKKLAKPIAEKYGGVTTQLSGFFYVWKHKTLIPI